VLGGLHGVVITDGAFIGAADGVDGALVAAGEPDPILDLQDDDPAQGIHDDEIGFAAATTVLRRGSWWKKNCLRGRSRSSLWRWRSP
jgi:hypothetical protein